MATITLDAKSFETTADRTARARTNIRVDHATGDQFAIAVRGHAVTVDQPVVDGGDDCGPTPTELFVAGLASCVAFYAGRYLARHDIDPGGLAVDASFEMGARPARVADIRIDVHVPPGLPEERREALLAVASHCTVHNSISTPPRISVGLVA
jgi:putative redox protein